MRLLDLLGVLIFRTEEEAGEGGCLRSWSAALGAEARAVPALFALRLLPRTVRGRRRRAPGSCSPCFWRVSVEKENFCSAVQGSGGAGACSPEEPLQLSSPGEGVQSSTRCNLSP